MFPIQWVARHCCRLLERFQPKDLSIHPIGIGLILVAVQNLDLIQAHGKDAAVAPILRIGRRMRLLRLAKLHMNLGVAEALLGERAAILANDEREIAARTGIDDQIELVLQRFPDELGRAYPGEKESEECRESRGYLDALARVCANWRQRLR